MHNQALGVDVSKWNGRIDWARVHGAGVSFAMVRVGTGSADGRACTVDPTCADNLRGALEAGLSVGAYLYSYAKSADAARREAAFAAAQLAAHKARMTLPLAYDLEDASQKALGRTLLTDMALAFTDEVRRLGFSPMLYSNPDWLVNRLDRARLSDIPLWLAEWGDAPRYPGVFTIWQFTAKGRIAGITGDVDLNRALPTRAAETAPAPAPSPRPFAARCTGASVHLRAGAGTQHASLGIVRLGEPLLALRAQNGWCPVAAHIGGRLLTGQMAARYVEAT